MQHTLAAVFDNRTSAQQAMDELIRCGFPSQDLTLKDSSAGNASAPAGRVETGDRDESFGQSVMHFFSDLFGAHHADTHVYTEAVNRGNTVLTFCTDDQDKVERAADVIEAYGPIDIDEYESQWRAGGWTGAESMRTGGYQGASMQSGQSSSGSSGGSNLQSGTAGMTSTAASGTRSGMSTSTGSTASFGSQNPPLQGSSAPGNAIQGSSSQGSEQRDTLQGSTGSMPASSDQVKMGNRTGQTGGVRVYSRLATHSSFLESEEGESSYRGHYMSHMARLGGSYDDYDPAYRYGSKMASDPVYRGRSWDDVEPTLRSDWESTNPGSAWERFKAAVRHGWERMTGDEDDEYRSHWASNYGGQGGNYEDYQPAYRYGSSMASTTYKGRKWDEIEPDLRSSWEASHPNDSWERVKASVRHGWDRMTGKDDDQYRSHWASNYANEGSSYDEYAPAYSYGSSMASDAGYRGRNWDDVESELRSDWETRYPGSAWDRFKAAVRHGWDRMTS